MPKILVVEDNQDVADIFKLMLQLNGFDVMLASNQEEFYSICTEIEPDLVITDVMLGNYDGRQLCKEFKQQKPSAKVILMSAADEKLVSYQQYGAIDVIQKPFELKVVISKIKKYVGE